MDVKKKANQIARKFKSRNPFEIIQGMNVILVHYPLNDVRGFYQYFQRNNIIYLDERLPEHEKKFVLAHEIGHMLMHKKANAIFMDTRTQFCTNKYELEADLFAIELLMPDEEINEYEKYNYTDEQISRITGYHKRLISLKMK